MSNDVAIRSVANIARPYKAIISTTVEYLPLGVVSASLDEFKRAMDNVYFINKLVTQNIEKLKTQSFPSVLNDLVKYRYFEDIEYGFILEFSYDESSEPRELATWNTYKSIAGYSVSDLRSRGDRTVTAQNGELVTYDAIATSMSVWVDKVRAITTPTSGQQTAMWFHEWTTGVKMYISIIRPHPSIPNRYIGISSGVSMSDYTALNVYNIGLFSPAYQRILTNLSRIIRRTSAFSSNDTTWAYGTQQEFSGLRCIKSVTQPEWTGKLIRNCYLNDTINIPEMVFNVMKDIESNYSTFYNGQRILSTFKSNGDLYVAVVNMIVDNANNIFIQIRSNNLTNEFPNSFIVKGDTTVNGSLTVSDYKNEKVLVVGDKITTLQGKMGINQQSYEVSGLLDIDNLSNRNITDFFELFAAPLRDSNNISKQLYASQTIDELTTKLKGSSLNDYMGSKNEFFVFSMDIDPTNHAIEYILYVNQREVDAAAPSELELAKSKYALNMDAEHKILLIVREISQMKDANDKVSDMVFSFVELNTNMIDNVTLSIRAKLYDKKIIFIATYINVDKYMDDRSYRILFPNFIDGLSSASRLVNYGAFLMTRPEIMTELKAGNSLTSITKAILEGQFATRFGLESLYLFCDYENAADETIYLYHEALPQWNGENANVLYVGQLNLTAGDALTAMTQYFENNYGPVNIENTFPVIYDWINGLKITMSRYITIDDIKYRISSGINVNDFINQSIIAKGDSRFTGDMSIQSPNGEEVFKVSTRDRTTSNMYNTGIGTQHPKTALEVLDIGVTDLLHVINSEVAQYSILNDCINTAKSRYNANTAQDTDKLIIDVIESILPSSKQNKYNYLACFKLDMQTKESTKGMFIYHWLFKQWEFIQLGLIDDLQNAPLIETIISVSQDIIDNSLLFDNVLQKRLFDFLYGEKRTTFRVCELGDVMYMFGIGIDFQINNLNTHSNAHMRDWLNVVDAQLYVLADIVSRIASSSIGNIYNREEAANTLAIKLNSYPMLSTNILELTFEGSIIDSVVSDLDLITLQNSNTRKIADIQDTNERTFMISIIDTLRTKYPSPKIGDYGIFAFEDTRYDYRGYSYRRTREDGTNTFVILYLSISDYILPSVDIYGDTRITGDLILSSNENDSLTNFMSVDPSTKFMGINTDVRKLFYTDPGQYVTLTSQATPSHHVVVRNDKYPNIVMERIEENNLGSNSAATMKRTSEKYTYDEIRRQYEIDEPDWTAKKGYGPDISFEVMDKTGYSREIGQIKMVIDKFDENGNICAGFGIQAQDYTISADTIEGKTKNIAYIDNTGTLYINQIMTGGKLLTPDGNGGLKYDNKPIVFDDSSPANNFRRTEYEDFTIKLEALKYFINFEATRTDGTKILRNIYNFDIFADEGRSNPLYSCLIFQLELNIALKNKQLDQYVITEDGFFGANTAKALQRLINAYLSEDEQIIVTGKIVSEIETSKKTYFVLDKMIEDNGPFASYLIEFITLHGFIQQHGVFPIAKKADGTPFIDV